MSSQSLPTQAQLDGALTGFGRDLGTGTGFPTQGPAGSALRRGDVYYHATYGALFVWNGAGWRARGPGELTAAQRTALVTANIPYAGFQVYETDTKLTWQWDGAAWSALNGVPLSGEWYGPGNGVPSATLINAPALTERRRSGGWAAQTSADLVAGKLTLPAGIWSIAWLIGLTSGVTQQTTASRNFAQITTGEDNMSASPGQDRRPVMGPGEDTGGATFLFTIAQTTTMAFQFFLSTTGLYNSSHVLRAVRLGAVT